MDDAASTRLAGKLETLSEAAIDKLLAILQLPIDCENGHLLRAHVGAAHTALHTQLRADALRLRAMRADAALERLYEILRAKERSVPSPSGFRTAVRAPRRPS